MGHHRHQVSLSRNGAVGWKALRAAAIGVESLAVAAVGAWAMGRVFSDRYDWSQWLLWVPTPAAGLAAGLGLAAASLRRSRARVFAWGAGFAAVAAHFALLEHRFLRAAPGPDRGPALRLVHASISDTGAGVRVMYERELDRLSPDVAILSIPVPAAELWRLASEMPSAGTPVAAWPFLLFSRLPILEARPLVASDGIYATVFRLDASATLGRTITVYAIDLPSDARVARAAIARRTRVMLEAAEAAPPDVVVGDLNMTRGGAALGVLFPDLDHAFDQAGAGYGASFHRAFPLYHIDHILLGPGLRAARYELHDPGFGRHRFQVVELKAPAPEQ